LLEVERLERHTEGPNAGAPARRDPPLRRREWHVPG
jgi:hypothetical protein